MMFFILDKDMCIGTADGPIDAGKYAVVEHDGDYITVFDGKVQSVNSICFLPCQVVPWESPTEDLIGKAYVNGALV